MGSIGGQTSHSVATEVGLSPGARTKPEIERHCMNVGNCLAVGPASGTGAVVFIRGINHLTTCEYYHSFNPIGRGFAEKYWTFRVAMLYWREQGYFSRVPVRITLWRHASILARFVVWVSDFTLMLLQSAGHGRSRSRREVTYPYVVGDPNTHVYGYHGARRPVAWNMATMPLVASSRKG